MHGIQNGEIELNEDSLSQALSVLWQQKCRGILDFMCEKNIKVCFYFGESYPSQLRDMPDPPSILYYVGDISVLEENCLAVVGSRHSTSYGRTCTELFAKECAQCGVCIISGMADGIDSIAHNSALEVSGLTCAVLGGGVDNIYPASNKGLYYEIASRGVIISEYPLSTRPQKYHFPERNRLIIGLSKCLLVTEAGMPSGTMSTVEFALEQNKAVFAIPGRIDSPASKGTNYLIKSGCLLASEPADVLAEFGIYPNEKKAEEKTFEGFDETETAIIKLLYHEPHTFIEIEEKLKLDSAELNASLTMLEISGVISQEAGRTYVLKK
ncbi:MAG: DNA-processing protein DprA [Clostridia bacterium]|nr:DNA-processing protein DprA [Clostridia bacterium]